MLRLGFCFSEALLGHYAAILCRSPVKLLRRRGTSTASSKSSAKFESLKFESPCLRGNEEEMEMYDSEKIAVVGHAEKASALKLDELTSETLRNMSEERWNIYSM